MNKKKLAIILVFILVAGIAAGLIANHMYRTAEEAERLRIYNETYLVVDGTEYRRDSAALDLSGKQLTEIEKLQELTALQQLDLRDTGITVAQYDALQAALPNCQITWSVPFQGYSCDSTVQELTVDTLSEQDLPLLAYLTELTTVNADTCTDYDVLFAMMERYPALSVSYTVSFGDERVPHTAEEIVVTDPSVNELLTQIPRLPNLKTVTLEGKLPDTDILAELKDALNSITLIWNFTVCGVETNSVADFLDLSGIKMDSTEELEAMLPCFYNLTKVDMVNCGLSNAEMDDLNRRNPGTRFIWEVKICGKMFRTDIRYFMPTKYKIKTLSNMDNLRYCKDIEVVDLGHYGVRDVSFIEDMPKLRCLLLLDCSIRDLYSIAACTSLEFLEIAQTPIREYWLLTNLTNLKDLNLSCTPYNFETWKPSGTNDIAMLYQFTKLDRLWFTRTYMSKAQYAWIHEVLPDTVVMLEVSGCTNFGWRYSPRYFEHRDIMGMYYMSH